MDLKNTAYTYQSVCDDLIIATHIDYDEVWYPENGEDEYEVAFANSFFKYTQDALLKEYPDYEIDPARFCFLDNDDFNAQAVYYNGVYSILINIGTVRNIFNLFDADLDDEEELIKLVRYTYALNGGPSAFFQCVALNFIMEHERAHLAQFSRQLMQDGATLSNEKVYLRRFENKKHVNSEDDEYTEFNIQDHVLEMDADLEGISFVGSFIISSLKTKFGIVPYDHFHELFAAAFASITVLFYYWSGNFDSSQLYYKDKEHPHSIIRFAYCFNYYFMLLQNNPEVIGFSPDIELIVNKAEEFRDRIFKFNEQEDIDRSVLIGKASEINNYIEFLHDKVIESPVTFQSLAKKRQ